MGGSVSNRKLLQYSISNISHAPTNNMYSCTYTYSNANASTNAAHGDGTANKSTIKWKEVNAANPAYNTYNNITFPARTFMRPCLCRRATFAQMSLCVCVHMFVLYHRKRNYFRLMGYLFLLQFNLNGFEMAFGWARERARAGPTNV